MKADFSTLQVQLEAKNSCGCFRVFIQAPREVWAARNRGGPRPRGTCHVRLCGLGRHKDVAVGVVREVDGKRVFAKYLVKDCIYVAGGNIDHWVGHGAVPAHIGKSELELGRVKPRVATGGPVDVVVAIEASHRSGAACRIDRSPPCDIPANERAANGKGKAECDEPRNCQGACTTRPCACACGAQGRPAQPRRPRTPA